MKNLFENIIMRAKGQGDMIEGRKGKMKQELLFLKKRSRRL